MIEFSNHGVLVEDSSELPSLSGQRLYLDFETTSGDPKKISMNPWFNCEILGACITSDDVENAWYVPARIEHFHG